MRNGAEESGQHLLRNRQRRLRKDAEPDGLTSSEKYGIVNMYVTKN